MPFTQTPATTTPALLLAAGLGSRLRPLTETIPKCLVPIHGRPLLDIWFELLVRSDFGPIYVNTHHHARVVEHYLETAPWKPHVFLSREPVLLGTGGTLLAHRHRLGNQPFFVAHADNLSRFDLAAFWLAHQQRPKGCILTMMTFATDNPSQCGIVELDQRNVVTAFHEKQERPPGNLANGAVFFMEPEIFDVLESCKAEQPDISLDLLPKCLGRIATWQNAVYHRDIGTPESYTRALKDYR